MEFPSSALCSPLNGGVAALCSFDLAVPGSRHRPHTSHARIHMLTRLEKLDSLGALVRLLGVLLVDVVVDLQFRRQGLQTFQDPGDELCHVGGGGGLGVGQGHVYHEDIGQDTGEGGWGGLE